MSTRSIRRLILLSTPLVCLLAIHATVPSARAAEPEDPTLAEYQRRLDKIAPGNVTDRYKLAVWCKDHDRLDLAAIQCKAILKLDPDHSQAKLLLRIAEPPKKKRPPRDPNAAAPPEIPRITEWDVQRLRFAEINLPRTDLDRSRPKEFDRVPVEFLDDARQRFWKQMQGRVGFTEKEDRVEFFKMSTPEQLGLVAMHTGWDYQRDVRINGDPQVFKTFKTRIWPLLKASCATSGCHGGPNSTAVRFLVDNDANTEVLYTNFLILDTIAVDDDRMIDRDRPRDSLLLTYCLPQDKSLKPHPDPPEIRAALRTPEVPRYDVIRDWILSLRNPHPDYGVELTDFPQDLRPPPSVLDLANDPNTPDDN